MCIRDRNKFNVTNEIRRNESTTIRVHCTEAISKVLVKVTDFVGSQKIFELGISNDTIINITYTPRVAGLIIVCVIFMLKERCAFSRTAEIIVKPIEKKPPFVIFDLNNSILDGKRDVQLNVTIVDDTGLASPKRIIISASIPLEYNVTKISDKKYIVYIFISQNTIAERARAYRTETINIWIQLIAFDIDLNKAQCWLHVIIKYPLNLWQNVEVITKNVLPIVLFVVILIILIVIEQKRRYKDTNLS